MFMMMLKPRCSLLELQWPHSFMFAARFELKEFFSLEKEIEDETNGRKINVVKCLSDIKKRSQNICALEPH